MSVYKPKKSPYWHYDFVHQGDRFYGSTGQETRRKAEAVERAKREALITATARLRPGESLNLATIPTLDQAAQEWWVFKGKALGRPETEELRATLLANAVELVGSTKLVTEIRTDDIAKAIAKRRGKLVEGNGWKRPRVASNCTVNRQVIDVVRPIIRRACKLLEVAPPPIDWGEVRLAEPKPKPRDFKAADLQTIIETLPIWYHDFARFASRYGARLEEMFFAPSDIDVEGRRLRLRDRKGDDDHVLPLLDEDVAMLAARKGRAEAAGLSTVWFRELKSGKLKALKLGGAKQAMRRVMRSTGLHASQGAKGSHDFRRHAAIQILRGTGNLRMAQKLLGHADIKSTLVYADVIDDDLRNGLASLSRNIPEPAPADAEKPKEKQRANGR